MQWSHPCSRGKNPMGAQITATVLEFFLPQWIKKSYFSPSLLPQSPSCISPDQRMLHNGEVTRESPYFTPLSYSSDFPWATEASQGFRLLSQRVLHLPTLSSWELQQSLLAARQKECPLDRNGTWGGRRNQEESGRTGQGYLPKIEGPRVSKWVLEVTWFGFFT